MKKIIFLASLASFGLLACHGYKDLSVEEFRSRLENDNDVQLLDVRTPQEFAEGHIPGAVNINWLGDGFIEAVQASIAPEQEILIYCRRGRRSAEAADTLNALGYKRIFNLKEGFNAWKNANLPVTAFETERFRAPGGATVEITLIKHASLAISYKAEADYILVTHEHGDHFDKDALGLLGGQIVTNANCFRLLESDKMKSQAQVLANGKSLTLQEGISVEAVPAYNTTPGREQFHPQGRDNGYILSLDGFRIYIAGDTEDIPEMADIKDIDVAFLPCNQPYTMTPEQCINAARMVNPKVLFPYHFGQTDVSGIPEALPGMDVRIRNMQ